VQRVNEQVDIDIIVATGLYTFDEIPHVFHYRGPGAILVHNPARYFTGGQE